MGRADRDNPTAGSGPRDGVFRNIRKPGRNEATNPHNRGQTLVLDDDAPLGPIGLLPTLSSPELIPPASDDDPQHGDDRLPRPGDRIRQYEVIREIGRGGMGAVYLARDIKLARRVAIKFLLSDDPGITERFIVEARATARCRHENIVVIYEVNEHHGNPFMVLEYLKGQSLRQLMDGRKMPVNRAVELIVPVVRALDCAHRHKLVHRDLKPENVLVTETGTVKVVDFGIVKLLHHQAAAEKYSQVAIPVPGALAFTHTGALIGTPPYMSPEQILGDQVDHRTDLWAVGIMLCELVTGDHPLAPISRENLMEIADLTRTMPSMSEIAPDAGKFGPVIDRCLIKCVDDRTATARALLDELTPLMSRRRGASVQEHTPFAGLAAFQESDADRFFGRDSDVADIATRLRNQPIVTIAGPSGVGKSSLVRAGVIPTLKRSGEGWEAFVVRPGRHPMSALASLIADIALQSSRRSGQVKTVEPGELDAAADRLRVEPGWLGTELRARAVSKLRRIVLFVDQFEELYTLGADPQKRAAFVACLEGAADDAASPVRVVLSMRSDFLDRLARARAVTSALTRGLVLLPPVGRDGLREALIQPVKAAGYEFESEALIDDMLDALDATPGALPLLQFTATELWDARDRDRRVLTRASYEAIGGVAGTLASHADAVLARMPSDRLALVQRIFAFLVTPERTRAVASVDELCELPGDPAVIERVIQDLASARLVAIENTADQRGNTVEIIHESLIDGWPTLTRWLDENQEDAAFLARLRLIATQWDRSGRRAGMLWRDEAMREARAWRARYRGELPDKQRDYLAAVFNLADRAARNKRWAIVGTMAALVLLLIAAGVALVKVRDAEREATRQNAMLRETSHELEQTLSREQRLRAAAERARRDADAARRDADVAKNQAIAEAAAARKARDDAEQAGGRARASEQRYRSAAQQASDSAREAKQQRAKADAARAKADAARAEAERQAAAKQRLIDRAVGPVKRTLR